MSISTTSRPAQNPKTYRNVFTSLDRAWRKCGWKQCGSGEAAISNPDSNVWKDCCREATSIPFRNSCPKKVLTALRKVRSRMYVHRSTCQCVGWGVGVQWRQQRQCWAA